MAGLTWLDWTWLGWIMLDWIMLWIGYIEPDWFSLDRIGLPARPYLFNQQPT
ncbi:hypothetical protein LK537_20670 [Lachnoclostridium pacaense]|uniref:hypothetical protein n=1 Tax=Enterocloster hominis (ex Hitch et al. 2024) TaxID=1917870 RepID=UPI001D0F6873|nr:hypothetical protein [Lachnoclostridium pacaense]MCC2819723.1 hypothetical protein [Lachnoclostridium pacaense]